MLFVKKLNGNFYFYVNFRKLNVIIRKDKYSLSLINEILIKLNKIIIFIKLNIR